MTDQEMAEALATILNDGSGQYQLVEAKVGEWIVMNHETGVWMGVAKFVRDWRVVGMVIQKCYEREIDLATHSGLAAHEGKNWVSFTSNNNDWEANIDESLPRAIIEAGIEALT